MATTSIFPMAHHSLTTMRICSRPTVAMAIRRTTMHTLLPTQDDVVTDSANDDGGNLSLASPWPQHETRHSGVTMANDNPTLEPHAIFSLGGLNFDINFNETIFKTTCACPTERER